MEKLNKLIELVTFYREGRAKLKAILSNIEIEEYTKWKQENPKDRTAMDKVIAQLKMEDKEWKELEEMYLKYDNKYFKYKTILDVVESMMSNPSFEKIDIINFLDGIEFEGEEVK